MNWVETRRNVLRRPIPGGVLGEWYVAGSGTGGAQTNATVPGVGFMGTAAFEMTWTASPTGGGGGLRIGIATDNFIVVVPQQVYTASAYFESNAAETDLVVRVLYYDAAGAQLSSSDGPTTAVAANTITRLSHTTTAPAGAARMVIHLRKNAIAGTPIGRRWRSSAGLVEPTSELRPWFWGGMTSDDPKVRYRFLGAAQESMSVQEFDDSPAVPEGVPVKLQDGGVGYMRLVAPSGQESPAAASLITPGFPSVQQMLDTRGATWAHRGGSENWPEMSEYAYDRSVIRGYGVLEFSAQRTVDGWWFGLHDPTVARTSVLSDAPNVNTLTRAQIEAYQNVLNSNGTPRPYYGLIEFLEKYRHHVIVLDPKNALSFNAELLDILDDHGGPNRFIWKWAGVGATVGAAAVATAARGYQTWGYFYEPSVANGELETFQGNWTMLGLNIGAGQPAWDAVKSYGKKVVGHIATTQGMYDTAMTKGADIVQCGNVADIAPVSNTLEG